MMELREPFRTLLFLVAVTGLRISEALGLKVELWIMNAK